MSWRLGPAIRRTAVVLSAATVTGAGLASSLARPAGAGAIDVTTPGTTVVQVPPDATTVSMVVQAAGGSGGDDGNQGGVGTRLEVTQPVTACADLTVIVGGAGSITSGGDNGGGDGAETGGGGGGGASQVNGPLGELLAIAGGGGGGGGGNSSDGDGGSGPTGGPVAVPGGTAVAGTVGQDGSGGFAGGGGGTASGGTGGNGAPNGTGPATTVAGAGGAGSPAIGNGGGGGGGAGWFGGGGGEGSGLGGGGGSGSSFVIDGSTGLTTTSAPGSDGLVGLTFDGTGEGTCATLGASVQSDGRTVDVSGTGFPSDHEVVVDIESTPLRLGSAPTDEEGAFAATFVVPCEVPGGEHLVVATAADAQASAGVTLVACPVATPVALEPTFTG